jgi:ABC-type multidrug transport system fused ATPase/permease subunit
MWWLTRCQPWRVLRGSVIGTAWMTGLAVRPYLVARAVDDGLRAGDFAALARWVGAIVVAGFALAYLGIMRHRTMTFIREDATARSAAVLLRHLSRVGAVLPRKLAAGEVATVGGSDIMRTSAVLTMTGPGVGAVVAYAVIAVVLWRISPLLALCILVGVPAVGLAVGPMLRRLEHAESEYRRQQGDLTARAGDIVAGLRVLAGVGGRGLFGRRYTDGSRELLAEGYRVGAVASWIEALTLVIPGLFLAAVVWLAARMAADGTITIGQMVAVYGYVAILVVPVWFLLFGAHDYIRGRVAARRIITLLTIEPDTHGSGSAPTPPRPSELRDPDTGLVVRPGRLLGVAADDPADAAALVDRLGRFVDSDVTWDGVVLSTMDLDEVRARILVADHDAYLFAATLRDTLGVRPGVTGADMASALHTASAADVVDALPDGLDAEVGLHGWTLSGGERQRVRLARALLADADVLILVDPTSAVDAHTEARIAERLRGARAGRTTVVIATSPLLLRHTDVVAHLRAGRVVATGTHAELLVRDPGYRALVSRDGSDDTFAVSDGGDLDDDLGPAAAGASR